MISQSFKTENLIPVSRYLTYLHNSFHCRVITKIVRIETCLKLTWTRLYHWKRQPYFPSEPLFKTVDWLGVCHGSHLFYIFVTLVPFAVWSWWCGSPRGVRLKCYYAFFLVCCGCDTSYIVSVHFQCQASIYTLSLCHGHSWRVRLAKQETLTPPGHLVSPLVCRGPWMSTMVLYCWCHSDSASVLLCFTFHLHGITRPVRSTIWE